MADIKRNIADQETAVLLLEYLREDGLTGDFSASRMLSIYFETKGLLEMAELENLSCEEKLCALAGAVERMGDLCFALTQHLQVAQVSNFQTASEWMLEWLGGQLQNRIDDIQKMVFVTFKSGQSDS